MIDATSEVLGTLPDGLKNAYQGRNQVEEVSRATVGQRLLGQLPDALIRVELGSVAGKTNQVEARDATREVLDQTAGVGSPSVPQDEDVATQVT